MFLRRYALIYIYKMYKFLSNLSLNNFIRFFEIIITNEKYSVIFDMIKSGRVKY